MYNFGLHGDNWLFFKNWYEEVTSKIKWNGNISRPIQEQQGVRQGGVWSPTAYKIFINKLLKTFEKNQLGAYIGCTYCGIPTVADDVTFISKSPSELQTMLDIQAYYANKQRYLLSEQKSTILVLNDKENRSWSLNNKDLSTSESAVHLGIERDSTSKSGSKEVICKRVITARKTTYSLMGAGLHGLNGVNPHVSAHLIQIYVIPRLLYGLDVINISRNDMEKLEVYHRKLMKQIQHLPIRSANSASLLLLGRIPIIGEIHKKILKTFGNIIRNDESVEKDIAIRQLAMKSISSGSWFPKVAEIADQYNLPSPHDLIDNPPIKETWNKLVNQTISSHFILTLQQEAENKSTLKYLNLSDTVPGKPHNIWTSCGNEPFAIIMAHLKAKIAVGTIVLQSSKAKHSKSEVSPICQLCHIETEDMIHFLIKCTVLKTTRSPFLQELKTFVKTCLRGENDETLFHELFNNNEYLARLIIDCSFFHFLKNTEKTRIETISRGLCYKLYQRRATILAENS